MTSPRMARMSVVLPAPFAPSTPTSSPSSTARSTRSSTRRPPIARSTPWNSMALKAEILLRPGIGGCLAQGAADGLDLRQYPLLIVHAGRLGLGHSHDRNVGPPRDSEQPFDRAARHLAVVEKDVHTMILERALEVGGVAGARLRAVHHGELEACVAHREPDGLGEVLRDRLGGCDDGAGEAGAQPRNLRLDGTQRCQEAGKVLRILLAVLRIERSH